VSEPVALPDEETAPTLGVIKTDVAPEVFQLSVVVPPALMLEGLEVKLLITGGEAAATVTVTCLVMLPAELLAVNVKVVVESGNTVI
ncbi:MAG: hypothetical protein P8105_11295, partial [Dehalococcoidia bacterium]